MTNKTILDFISGSKLYGTQIDSGSSDLDFMSIVIENKNNFLSFSPTETWVQRQQPEGVRSLPGDVELTIYGLKKYLKLALAGNPTILLALFVKGNMIQYISEEGEELQALAPHIISRQVAAPFKGYMRQQYERLIGERGQKNCTRPELVEKYGFDTKYAGHIVRLGYQGIELLKTGRLTLPMRKEDAELVREIRMGKWSFNLTCAIIKDLEEILEDTIKNNTLPERPDTAYVQEWMINTYLKYWTQENNSCKN